MYVPDEFADWFMCNLRFFGRSFRAVFLEMFYLCSDKFSLNCPKEISRKNPPIPLLKWLNPPINLKFLRVLGSVWEVSEGILGGFSKERCRKIKGKTSKTITPLNPLKPL